MGRRPYTLTPAQQAKNEPISTAPLLPGVELEGGRAVEAVGGVRIREVFPAVDEGVHETHRSGRHVSGDDGARSRRPVRLIDPS